MSGKTVKRADLVEVLWEEIGLAREQCAAILESFLDEIGRSLTDGEPVKIQNFGTFSVRQKGERMGRNPRTGEEVPILPRKVVVFRASQKLKHWTAHPEDLPLRPRRQAI